MGRFLDIAQALPVVETAASERVVERLVKQSPQLDRIAYRTEGGARSHAGYDRSAKSAVSPPEWDQGAADVLDILARADAPMLHTALVAALAARGHGKAAACKAIAGRQRRDWIEHNLVTGYELSGG